MTPTELKSFLTKDQLASLVGTCMAQQEVIHKDLQMVIEELRQVKIRISALEVIEKERRKK